MQLLLLLFAFMKYFAKNTSKPRCLLINPWIYDFAAHDFWAKPLGLLYIASWLRENGWEVHFIDCLDTHDPRMTAESYIKPAKRRPDGTGKFFRQIIPKPIFLAHIPRYYYRFGITPRLFLEKLNRLPPPDTILVTSGMTYWYPGVFAAIRICKEKWPDVPVILGGIYATLCYEHAVKFSGADYVLKGMAESCLPVLFEKLFSQRLKHTHMSYPAFDLLSHIDYVCLLTSRGCPFHCPYCASSLLFPNFQQRSPAEVFKEVLFWHKEFNVKIFAFYDDALLLNAQEHIIPFFEMVIKNKIDVEFHTPNGLHARFITAKLAKLMKRARVKTIRLGFETSSENRLDKKLTREEFIKAVHYLLEAGFTPKEIGAYILIGLPEQTYKEIEESVNFVKHLGITPRLAEYSPIPGTPLWEKAITYSHYDLNEPLAHNNSILPCAGPDLSWENIKALKKKIWQNI